MNGQEIQRLVKVETTLGGVEKRLTKVEGKLEEILTNHLPHIRQEIQANKYKIAATTGAAAFIGSKLVDILFK